MLQRSLGRRRSFRTPAGRADALGLIACMLANTGTVGLVFFPGLRRTTQVADQLSRLFRTESPELHAHLATLLTFPDLPDTDNLMLRLSVNEVASESPEDLLAQAHGGRQGHGGAKRTYDKLSKLFPGHRIPVVTAK